jgi:hypothetical protein
MSSVDNSWSWFPNERIVHSVEFESEDPAFAGEMKMTWTLSAVPGGTHVAIRCENVPAGIRHEDNETASRRRWRTSRFSPKDKQAREREQRARQTTAINGVGFTNAPQFDRAALTSHAWFADRGVQL